MKFIRLILMICVMFALLWCGGLLWFVSRIEDESPRVKIQTDVIVVLTGGSDRLAEGLRLLDENYASRLFVSGAGEGVTLQDVFRNASFPLSRYDEFVPRVEIGYEAQTTHGNAEEVASWLKQHDYRSIRLITSNYHMDRSYLELVYLMPDIKIIKHAVVPKHVIVQRWWKFKGSRKLITSEYNKFLGAILQREFSHNRRR
jgi:uncharacterized SAM-binding protein YcdF (DUF218 family)